MDIRNGFYRDENGMVKKEFNILIDSLSKELEEAYKNTILNDYVDEKLYKKLYLDLTKDVF